MSISKKMSTSRVLIIGASGFIGKAIYKELSANGCKVYGTYFKNKLQGLMQLDIRNKEEIERVFSRIKPDVVVQPAAEPHVDLCEQQKDSTYEINVMGTKNVVDACSKANAMLVYFSSDYIFDGKKGPYTEGSRPNPISEYGRQKLECERIIKKKLSNYLIIRTTVVFGYDAGSKNFVMQLVDSLRKKNERKVPVDQYSHPTYVNDLAIACSILIKKGKKGVYNIVGNKYMSRYEFALLVSDAFALDKNLVIPVATEELGQPAKRPLRAGLDNSKVRKDIKMKFSPLSQALNEIKRQFPK